MVAHNLTDTPAFPAVMVRRRPLFREHPLTGFLTLGLFFHAVRQSRGRAMLPGGSFDHSGASPRHRGEWRKHHEAVPSTVDRIQGV